MKTNIALASVLAAALAACHHAPDKAPKTKPDKVLAQVARDTSKWIRSNNKAYWSFARTNLEQVAPVLTEYLAYEGLLVGDAHLANFSSVPVTLAAGSAPVMRYIDIDYDDVGHGPFVLDLARLVITSKASKPAMSSEEVVESYVKGLRGEPMEIPMAAQHVLDKTVDDYRRQYDTNVANKTDKKSFKYKAGKIEAYAGKVTAEMIQPYLPGMKIIDIALRPIDRGGSAGFLRLWVYAKPENGAGRGMFYELKELEPTALSAYKDQLTIDDIRPEIMATFLPGITSESLNLIDLGDAGKFWLREKKVTLINIPYKSQKTEDVIFVQQLSDYDAYYLGQLHGKQAGGRQLAARLETQADRARLAAALRPFERAFLEFATAKVMSQEPVKN